MSRAARPPSPHGGPTRQIGPGHAYAAAYFYRKQNGEDSRILILDNHDDFGGHAKRNEFWLDGEMLLGFGGAISIEAPDDYSPESRRLLEELGIDFGTLDRAIGSGYTFADLQQSAAFYLNENVYGEDQIVRGDWMTVWQGSDDAIQLINQLPVSDTDRQQLIELVNGDLNFIEDIPLMERWEYLHTTSYKSFLRDRVGLSDKAMTLFEPICRFTYSLNIDSISIAEGIMLGAPGLRGLGWLGNLASMLVGNMMGRYHANVFPDGNASVARLLVRNLIPGVAAGSTMEDVVTARFDYGALDLPGNSVRLRLNSTVVNVEHVSDGAVAISYIEGGTPIRLKAGRCILACYNSMIPFICPELPEAQKEALGYSVKPSFVYTNVLIRSGEPYYKTGVELFNCPGSFFSLVDKAPPTKLGNYRPSDNPRDPMIIFMGHAPGPANNGKQTGRELLRENRYKLLSTPFSTYEREIHNQLNGMFGATGFDAERDIEAITVNRWSHGWAYDYMDLFDPNWREGQAPHELGRKQFGQISIANSDSEARGYMDAAIDAAWRAVQEQRQS